MKPIKEIYQNNGDVYLSISEFQKQGLEYPYKPSLPRLKSTSPTIKEITEYQSKLDLYKEDSASHESRKDLYKKEQQEKENQLWSFIEEHAELNIVPDKYHDKLRSMAWEKGHSEGWYSVLTQLKNLVSIFE